MYITYFKYILKYINAEIKHIIYILLYFFIYSYIDLNIFTPFIYLSNHSENSFMCLRLVLAQTKQQWEAVGKQVPGLNLLSFETTTLMRDYEQLTSAGVKFLIVPPRIHAWGYETSFLDLYGNQIGLFQHL